MRKGMPPKSDDVFIINADERLFKSWATVEIVDNQGQIIPIKQFKKIMPKLMKRGAPLTLYHVGTGDKPQAVKIVGRLLNYEFLTNPQYDAEGMLVTGQIFSDFKMDDEAWHGIQSGELSGLSVAGTMAVLPSGESVWIEPCAFGLGKPANPAATIVAMSMAKTDDSGNRAAEQAMPEEDSKEPDKTKGGVAMIKEEKDAEKEEEKKDQTPETQAPIQPQAPTEPAQAPAPLSSSSDEITKTLTILVEGLAKQSDLLNKILNKLGGADDVKASVDSRAKSEAPKDEPAEEKTETKPNENKEGEEEASEVVMAKTTAKDEKKAAVLDLSKGAAPQPLGTAVTPKPEIKEVIFNPDHARKGMKKTDAMKVARGEEKLDTLSFVRSGELWSE